MKPFPQSIVFALIRRVVERRAGKLTYADFTQRLSAAGAPIVARFGAAADTPENRAQANHVIGIERWGQRRLSTALGEAPVTDEYDGYKEPATFTMAQLRDAFSATRAGTLQIIAKLQQGAIPITRTAVHNDLGPLSMGGWLTVLSRTCCRIFASGRRSSATYLAGRRFSSPCDCKTPHNCSAR